MNLSRHPGLDPGSQDETLPIIMATKAQTGAGGIRLRVRAYESKILDASIKQIIDIAKKNEAEFRGPVPLPVELKKYTVNRSTFVHKDAREQFEIRVHKRLIDILNPNPKLIEALGTMNLPSGVEVDMKMM